MAFFTDSFHEANGVARTSREFAAYARSSFFPFLAVHPGTRTAHLRRGTYEAFELAPSAATLQLEHDLTFDLLFMRHFRALRRTVAAFEPDLIHITGPGHCGILGAMLAYSLGVPLVASWHTNVHEYASRRLARMLQGWPQSLRHAGVSFSEQRALDLTVRFYQLARILFAPNPELMAMLKQRTSQPVHLMARGIDCRLFHPQRRTATGHPFTIGYVGRLSTEKNVRLFAALEAQLRQSGITDHRFLIVGEGSEREWLRQNLTNAELPGVLHGDALATAYANMDAFVFPSETDTYGNVVQEALASGVPCIVSAHGGPQFLIEAGETGFVAQDPSAYATAITRLIQDPALLARMRIHARAAALERNWNAVFDDVYAAYRMGLKEGTIPRSRRASRPSTNWARRAV